MTGWTEEGLLRSWRALAAPKDDEDWRIVRIADFGPLSVDAGCRFPGGNEALLVAFPADWFDQSSALPQGNGFDAQLIVDDVRYAGRKVVALVRSDTGAVDIFAIMAVDLLRLVEGNGPPWRSEAYGRFIGRLREWQEFMGRKPRPLSQEAQTGLYGELWALEKMLEGMPATAAFESWKGPLHSAQDFHLGSGAFEVKSTASKNRFVAKINSIDQLDCDRAPMYVVALRFEEMVEGRSLNQLVEAMRAASLPAGRSKAFDAMLSLAGYLDEHAPHYGRLLALDEIRILHLDDNFPCLRRAALPPHILQAKYELDLQSIPSIDIEFCDLLQNLGADQK